MFSWCPAAVAQKRKCAPSEGTALFEWHDTEVDAREVLEEQEIGATKTSESSTQYSDPEHHHVSSLSCSLSGKYKGS